MKIILICCTINPSLAVQFLNSVSIPSGAEWFEIILVNSSTQEVVLTNVSDEVRNSIRVMNAPGFSLSRARNYALTEDKDADIIAFPDDDCIYPLGLLDKVVSYYEDNGDPNCKGVCFPHSGSITHTGTRIVKDEIFGRVISFNFFLFDPETLHFNENFGIGGKYDFGEEAELVARTLDKFGYLLHDQNFLIEHPLKDGLSFKRTFRRGFGIGAFVITTGYLEFSRRLRFKLLFGAFAKFFYRLVRGEFRLSFHSLADGLGRLSGFVLAFFRR